MKTGQRIKANQAVTQLRQVLNQTPPEDRLIVFSQVTAGYCTSCGTRGEGCQCWNNK